MSEGDSGPDLAAMVAGFLRHHHSRAKEDYWAWEAVQDRVSQGTDAEDAWKVTIALVEAADLESELGAVAAGPLEGLVVNFSPALIDRIERRAATDPKFRRCLQQIWLQTDELPAPILERVVAASGGVIEPLAPGEPPPGWEDLP